VDEDGVCQDDGGGGGAGGGGQEIPGEIRCLTGSGSTGGFDNGTCAGCSLGATGTTPLGAALGLGILMFLPWVLRKSLVRARR
jgi:hypothetical protein